MFSMMPGQGMSPQLMAMLQAQGGGGVGGPMGGGMPSGAPMAGPPGAPLQGLITPQPGGGGGGMMGGGMQQPMQQPQQPGLGQQLQSAMGGQPGSSGLAGFAQLLKALGGQQSGVNLNSQAQQAANNYGWNANGWGPIAGTNGMVGGGT